jgi:hypothetical protein
VRVGDIQGMRVVSL